MSFDDNNQTNDKLVSFLKLNKPAAPTPPKNELAQIQRRLGLLPVRSQFSKRWFGAGATIAASVIAGALFVKSPNRSEHLADTVAFEESYEEDLFAEELPALDVGEDYYQFFAAVETQ